MDNINQAQIVISDHPWSKEHRDLVEDFLRPQGLKASPWSYQGSFDQESRRLDQCLTFQSDQRTQTSYYDASGPLSWWIKREVYQFLAPMAPVKLPWGTITGVRPLKVVRKSLNESRESDLEDFYCMDPQKIDLSKRIIRAQEPILKKCSEKTFSLYIHIPFCPTRCSYCSFPSLANPSHKQMEAYVDVLVQELVSYAPYLKSKALNSVYLGGGTPTQLTSLQLKRLLETIHFHFGQAPELTVEAGRPDTITEEKLKVLNSQGVTRISVNPQSFSDKTLEAIGRSHTVEDVIRASHKVKDMGFDLNMDLILGLPGEGTQEMIDSIKKARQLAPDNLSIHALAIKKGASLSSEDAQIIDPNLSEMIRSYLAETAHIPYYLYRQRHMIPGLENTGYALKDKVCHYNVISMEEAETILACGMGSVSKIHFDGKIHQVPNFRSYHDYMERMEEKLATKIKFLL